MGSRFNVVGSILIRPLNRSGFAIVGADVTHDFAVQIFDRSKDSACDQIALDFREPDFDLIEPGGIGRRVMDTYFRVARQKIADRLGFMRAQVVADDVNGSFWSLTGDQIFQKGDELCTAVAGAGLAHDLAALSIKSRIERKGSMTIILKAVSFSSTGRERQHWIQTIQCLDGTLFVDTEHCSVERRFKVQTEDIGRLLFKLRVGARHVAAYPMGLNSGPRPDTRYSTMGNAQMLSQPSGAPMSRAIGGCLLSGSQNSGLLGDDGLRDNLATMPGIQTRQALFKKRSFHRAMNTW